MKLLDIGSVAKLSAVRPSALRYYEEIGLIRPVSRRGLRRQYDRDVLIQLAFIAMGKAAGFSLADIAGVFRLDGKPHLPRSRLRSRAEDLGRQIRELTALQSLVRHVAECPQRSHLECPRFRKLMAVAMRRHAMGSKPRPLHQPR